MSSNFLLYDGECPACRSYVAIARLRELWPDLRILDARGEPELVSELRAKGLEINQGFVLSLGGTLYFGPEATRMIGERGRSHGGMRGGLLRAIGTAPWSRSLYPWLNRGRQLLLAALGKSLIR
jgi:predicted DCC family thiol-disulfide oxidoreductase YuxK